MSARRARLRAITGAAAHDRPDQEQRDLGRAAPWRERRVETIGIADRAVDDDEDRAFHPAVAGPDPAPHALAASPGHLVHEIADRRIVLDGSDDLPRQAWTGTDQVDGDRSHEPATDVEERHGSAAALRAPGGRPGSDTSIPAALSGLFTPEAITR